MCLAMYFDLVDSIFYPAILQFETPNARRCISKTLPKDFCNFSITQAEPYQQLAPSTTRDARDK